jgi:hypothetical protein
VRLKITRALSGSIDGIHLSQFVVGREYEVDSSVGSFLVSVGAAEVQEGSTTEHGEHVEQPVLARRGPRDERAKK